MGKKRQHASLLYIEALVPLLRPSSVRLWTLNKIFTFFLIAFDPRQWSTPCFILRKLHPSFREFRLRFHLKPLDCGRTFRSEQESEKMLKRNSVPSPPPFWFLLFKQKNCFFRSDTLFFISLHAENIPEQIAKHVPVTTFRWREVSWRLLLVRDLLDIRQTTRKWFNASCDV